VSERSPAPPPEGIAILTATTPALVDAVRGLIVAHTSSFGVDPEDPAFVDEMAALPGGEYAPPAGTLLVAVDRATGEAIGCIAVRPIPRWAPDSAELRRMYVAPSARRRGVGRALVRTAEGFARDAGYRRLRLVSLTHMEEAHRLYESEGFAYIEPYRTSTSPEVVYMERTFTEG
jgi:GNAT superfamily N-acetyltransferase